MEELNRKGLAQRLSVEGPATWTCPGRDEVLDRLDALHVERLNQQRARTDRIRELLATALPEAPTAATAYVQVIQGAAQVGGIYEKLLRDTTSELLVFNRPPYSQVPEEVNPVILETVHRGVDARVLYQAEQWEHADAKAFRVAMEEYHRAGVQGALVDELPVKLAVADRRAALLAMTDPILPEIGFPTTLFVEHPGFAALQAEAFERLWEGSQPL